MSDNNTQHRIFESVAARGYVHGWTTGQLLARQVVKLLEESCELYLSLVWPHSARFDLLHDLVTALQMEAKVIFDDPAGWQFVNGAQNREEILSETSDVAVTLVTLIEAFNIAFGCDVSLLAAALEKASADKERGVRYGLGLYLPPDDSQLPTIAKTGESGAS